MEVNKPSPLKMTGNLIENFKLFKQELQIFFDATEFHTKKEATQVEILLNMLGPDGLKVYNTLEGKKETVGEILNALEIYCISKTNKLMEHYQFFTRKQGAEEPFDNFYTDLKQLIKTCRFDQCEEDLLKVQIVLGISNKNVQTSLLSKDLPLEKVVDYCRSEEQTENNRRIVQEINTHLLFSIDTSENTESGTNSNNQSTQNANSNPPGSKHFKIPIGWLDFTPYSTIIVNRFLAFKTPLDSKYRVPMSHIFNIDMLFSSMAEKKVDLRLWIDLTTSNNYYDQLEVINNNCHYVKLPLVGNEDPPTSKEVDSFLDICRDFVSSNPNLHIGVHCHHGLNQAGFLIITWLIEVLHYNVIDALQEFAAARSPGITKQPYINELYRRYEVRRINYTD
ncbi:Protein-tyrosine phosphatase-like,Dual specificity phosphatase, catalytic domain,Tyrosine [Cinara cedri]|uniref:Protein-tyrosine phosphatase-like,Dual specificity phosphatase, catalytic domain,Tyrosine n=1 Tax=Cinara cedri TaxID=506608 RepID=A0A5E4MR21_9HEMI|nr:Protein-tyrosine phosphatase-like,Dual specificity phosphatase, catalytic domain,Tyrosine [Cinara cedri]